MSDFLFDSALLESYVKSYVRKKLRWENLFNAYEVLCRGKQILPKFNENECTRLLLQAIIHKKKSLEEVFEALMNHFSQSNKQFSLIFYKLKLTLSCPNSDDFSNPLHT